MRHNTYRGGESCGTPQRRVYACPSCGSALDRNINAARNIERWHEGICIPGIHYIKTASSAAYACGVDKPNVNIGTSVKQELELMGRFNKAE